MDFYRKNRGQSLIEAIIAIAIGAMFFIAGAGIIAPALKTSKQTRVIQTQTELGRELLDNTKVWATANWNNLLAIATSSANQYHLLTAQSPYSSATGTETVTIGAPTNGLVGYWTFDEGTGSTTYDSSGNNNNGAWQGTASGTSGYYSAGKLGTWAGTFDGTDNYVDISNQAQFNFADATFTATGWFKTSTTSAEFILGKVVNGGGWGVAVNWGSCVGGAGHLCATMKDSLNSQFVQTASTSNLNDNNWHQFAAVITTNTTNGSAQSALMYIDGALSQGSTTLDSNPYVVASGDLHIGNRNTTPSNPTSYFAGSIDDIRIYNRALSSAEVQALYSSSATTYQRYFYLSDAYRTSAGNLTATASGNYYDPSAKLVTAVTSNASTNSFAYATTTISEYLTRNANNIYDQSDWSGGSGQDTPVTVAGNTFATSTKIVTNAAGQLTLSTAPSGLVGWWTFDEGTGTTAYDSSGNGNNGTFSSPAPTWTTGEVGSGALSFNGTSSYVSVPSGPTLTYNPITFAVWVNEPTSTLGTFMIGKSTYGGFLRDYGNGQYEWDIYSGGEHNIFATIPSYNQWHFIVGTYDGSVQKLYVDGTLATSTNLSVTPQTTSDFGIGACIFCGPSQFTKGLLDDARIYNRALSATEVQRLYNASGTLDSATFGVTTGNQLNSVTWLGSTSISNGTVKFQFAVSNSSASSTLTSFLGPDGTSLSYFGGTSGATEGAPVTLVSSSTSNGYSLFSGYLYFRYRITLLSNASTPPMSGLVGWWTFDEGTGTTAYDSSGNGNNGSWHGTAGGTSGYYSAGKVGQWAGYFDGTDNYILMTSSSILSSFSVAAWINPTSLASRSDILGYADIFFNIQNGKICQYVAGVNSSYLCGNTSVPTSSWSFAVATWDGSTEKIFYNGSLDGSVVLSGTPASWNSPDIGVCGSGCGFLGYFPGLIDDVRIYNRALSPTEVQALYSSYSSGSPTVNQVIINWSP